MSNDKYIHSDVEDKIYSYWEKNDLFMIFEMVRRAKPLNQFAYLQQHQWCAASQRGGPALPVFVADLLQKSGVLGPPRAAASPPESQNRANNLLFVRSFPNY